MGYPHRPESLLHVIPGDGGFDVQGDRLAGEWLDEDLHPMTKAEDEMETLCNRKECDRPQADCLQR